VRESKEQPKKKNNLELNRSINSREFKQPNETHIKRSQEENQQSDSEQVQSTEYKKKKINRNVFWLKHSITPHRPTALVWLVSSTPP